MYFDPQPKKKREDLYNFESEYKELKESVKDPKIRLIALYGLRRTGKTSFLNVCFNELKGSKLYVDVRQIYPLTPRNLSNHFMHLFMDILKELKLIEAFLEKIKGIEIGPLKIDLKDKESILAEILSEVDKELEKKSSKLAIFVDEAQLLKPLGFDKFMAYIYDNLNNIKLIVAGSEIGILDKLLGQEEEAPLFGRSIKKINLHRLDKNRVIEFLTLGFKQAKMAIKESEIEKVREKLDGTIGWLSFFGWESMQTKDVNEGLKRTIREGSKAAYKEFNIFLKIREIAGKRYANILKALSRGALKWHQIRDHLELNEKTKISNKQISEYLSNLAEYGFIEKNENLYSISDPLLREAFARGIAR